MNTNQTNSDNPMRDPLPQVPISIEPWQITAYALGELEGESLAEVESWISKNPSAATEVQAIRDTATHIRKQLATSTLNGGLDGRRSEQVLQEITGNSTGIAAVQLRERDDEDMRLKRFRRYRTMGLIASGIAASLVAFRLSPWYPERVEIVSGTKTVFNIPLKTEEAVSQSLDYIPPVLKDATEMAKALDKESSFMSLHPQHVEMDTESVLDKESSGMNPGEVVKQSLPADGLGYMAGAQGTVSSSNGAVTRSSLGRDGSNASSLAAGAEKHGVAIDWNDANRPLSEVKSEASEQSVRQSGVARDSLDLESESERLSETVQKRIAERGAVELKVKTTPQSGETLERRSLELVDRVATVPNPSFGGIAGGGMGGNRSMGLSGGRMPAEPRGERGLENRESDRRNQFPDELKANVPSLRRASENASGDRFEPIVETPFAEVKQSPQSTFSIDVDTASYSKIRQYILGNVIPNPAAVRIEEMINYFDYNYPGPTDGTPFAAHMKMAICPWNTEHRLVRVAIQAKKVSAEQRPASNLVFLIDVSGSMSQENKLPLVKRTLALLASQLREQDRVAIVVYAGAAGCVLPSTSGASKDRIMASIDELQSGGSTNGGQGIELAYRIAKENYVEGGVNRVILCTDGDFNVGVTGTDQLVTMMQDNAKSNVFLTCLGYGIGNYNDSMMEQISNKGNGNYGMVDSEMEARKIMVEQLSGTLMTVAKDVKIQIEFNPQKVASYRLIGYENRRLATQDFDNDKKDAGEIGAGHRVTALYEIVPVGKDGPGIPGGELRYGKKPPEAPAQPAVDAEPASELANEWMLLKIRSKQPEASESTKQEFVLKDEGQQEESYPSEQADLDWAVSVAEFGLLLRNSQMAPGIDWDRMIARAIECVGEDTYRRECLELMRQARRTAGR